MNMPANNMKIEAKNENIMYQLLTETTNRVQTYGLQRIAERCKKWEINNTAIHERCKLTLNQIQIERGWYTLEK